MMLILELSNVVNPKCFRALPVFRAPAAYGLHYFASLCSDIVSRTVTYISTSM